MCEPIDPFLTNKDNVEQININNQSLTSETKSIGMDEVIYPNLIVANPFKDSLKNICALTQSPGENEKQRDQRLSKLENRLNIVETNVLNNYYTMYERNYALSQ